MRIASSGGVTMVREDRIREDRIREDRIRDDLASGVLVAVLEAFCTPFPGYYL